MKNPGKDKTITEGKFAVGGVKVPFAIKGFEDEASAKADCDARNQRAKEYGTSERYVVVPTSELEPVA